MCGGSGGFGGLISTVLGIGSDQGGAKVGDVGTIGQPDTAKTQIGDTGTMAAARKKPRSLLSGAAGGDTSSAGVNAPGAKATLGG